MKNIIVLTHLLGGLFAALLTSTAQASPVRQVLIEKRIRLNGR